MKRFETATRRFFNNRQSRISVTCFLGLLAFSAFACATVKSGGKANSLFAVAAQNAMTGEWTAELERSRPGEIKMLFHSRSQTGGFSMMSRTVAASELQGLTTEAMSAAKANVNFNIVHQAGTFACEGYFREGKGVGFWTFTPSQSFVSAMRERGYPDLTGDDLLKAALHNLTTKFIEDLKAAGYDRPEFKQVLRAASHDVTPGFIREMQSAGYQGLSMEQLVRARNHDIDSQYVKEVRAMGFDKQPLEKLIRLRNHEISQEFINRMRAAGFDNLSIEELIRLRNHDITPEFVNGLKAEGYSSIPPATAIRLKNHDIDRDYIRRVKARGFTDITLEQLIRLRSNGIVK
jgi:uncharacterized protein (UPF0335 family)